MRVARLLVLAMPVVWTGEKNGEQLRLNYDAAKDGYVLYEKKQQQKETATRFGPTVARDPQKLSKIRDLHEIMGDALPDRLRAMIAADWSAAADERSPAVRASATA